MLKQYKTPLNRVIFFLDLLIILLSFYVSYDLKVGPIHLKTLPIQYITFFISYAIVWIYLSKLFKLYSLKKDEHFRFEAWDVIKTTALCLAIASLPAFFIRDYPIGRLFLLYLWSIQTGFLILFRWILRETLKFIHSRGYNFRRVLLIGRNERSIKIAKKIDENSNLGLRIIGFIDAPNNENGFCSSYHFNVIGHLEDLEKILREQVVDEVFISLPIKSFYSEIQEILRICENVGVEIKISTDLFSLKLAKSTISLYGDVPVIDLYTSPMMDWRLVIKRLIDISISSLLLLLLSPLFLLIAILIKCTSKGPIFYPWKVVGQNNREFIGYKFRTMLGNAEGLKETLMAQNEMKGPVFKMKNDPRITFVGKWLRKFSLDELPQLWSVLKGDMSLVGPRPPSKKELERFDFWQRRKISFKPGITCLWQVNGRNVISDFNEWCQLDLEYIDNWSLWLDMKILFKTAWVVIKGTGY